MRIDMYQVKLSMIVNLVRDYYTLKDGASVGVLILDDDDSTILEVNSLNGISGSECEIDISHIIAVEDPMDMIELLLEELQGEGD